MKSLLAICILAFSGCVSSSSTPIDAGETALKETRFTEPGRSQFFFMCLSMGAPVTHCRCMEIENQGNKETDFEKTSDKCFKALKAPLTEEMNKSNNGTDM